MVEEDLIAIPLSWYSGWAFGETGQNALESYTNYCLESMNAIEYLSGEMGIETVAIISFPGEYGGDGAAGAAKAAEALGLEVVFDGTGQVTPPSADNPSPDQTAIISQIVESNADLVWAVINPTQLGSDHGWRRGPGLHGPVVGQLADLQLPVSAVGPRGTLLDQYYTASTYIVTWGSDVPGMQEVVDAMTEARPDLPVSDMYLVGWTEGMITKAVLEQAAANGDMTRAGIVAAANEVTVDFNGLAPTQTWAGEPNDFVVRESYIYDVDLSALQLRHPRRGRSDRRGARCSPVRTSATLAADYDFTEPCFVSG